MSKDKALRGDETNFLDWWELGELGYEGKDALPFQSSEQIYSEVSNSMELTEGSLQDCLSGKESEDSVNAWMEWKRVEQ